MATSVFHCTPIVVLILKSFHDALTAETAFHATLMMVNIGFHGASFYTIFPIHSPNPRLTSPFSQRPLIPTTSPS